MRNEVRLLATVLPASHLVDVSPDPADDFLVSMAEEGEADFLVTGDATRSMHAGSLVGKQLKDGCYSPILSKDGNKSFSTI